MVWYRSLGFGLGLCGLVSFNIIVGKLTVFREVTGDLGDGSRLGVITEAFYSRQHK